MKRVDVRTSIPEGRYRQLRAFAAKHKLSYSRVIDNALRVLFELVGGKIPDVIAFNDESVNDPESETF